MHLALLLAVTTATAATEDAGAAMTPEAGAASVQAVVGTLDISNRIEMRGRETQTPAPQVTTAQAKPGTTAVTTPTLVSTTPPLPNPGVDLVDVPSARMTLKGHTWETSLDYSAFTIIPDLETGAPVPQVLQTANLGQQWHDRQVRFALFEYGQYGLENSAYLLSPTASQMGPSLQLGNISPPTGGTAVQALTNPQSVRYGASRTDLTTQVTLSRRLQQTTLLEYAIQGGVDAQSRVLLPIVYGPRAEETFRWNASHVDALETKLALAHSDASQGACSPVLLEPLPAGSICAPTGDILFATETWRRRTSRHTDVWIGAGPAFVAARLRPSNAYEDAFYPAALTGFQYRSSTEDVRTVVRLDAQLAPLVDVRTGIVDNRAQGMLTLQVPLRDIAVTGSLSGTRTVESLLSQPVESVQGSLEIDIKVDSELSLGAGVRYAWQDQAGLGTFSSGLAFAQATFRTKEIRF